MSRAWAQTSPPVVTPQSSIPNPQSSSSSGTQQLPVDLGRIREGLAQPIPAKKFDDGRLRFFAETQEKLPSFKELSFGFDLFNGPVPGAGMTHQDFLTMVTPKYINSSGGIKAIETLEWGLVNYAAVWTVKRLYKELSEAKTAMRKREIQQQIDRELAALKGGGK